MRHYFVVDLWYHNIIVALKAAQKFVGVAVSNNFILLGLLSLW